MIAAGFVERRPGLVVRTDCGVAGQIERVRIERPGTAVAEHREDDEDGQ